MLFCRDSSTLLVVPRAITPSVPAVALMIQATCGLEKERIWAVFVLFVYCEIRNKTMKGMKKPAIKTNNKQMEEAVRKKERAAKQQHETKKENKTR